MSKNPLLAAWYTMDRKESDAAYAEFLEVVGPTIYGVKMDMKSINELRKKAAKADTPQSQEPEAVRFDAAGDRIPWLKEYDHFFGFDPENPDVPTD